MEKEVTQIKNVKMLARIKTWQRRTFEVLILLLMGFCVAWTIISFGHVKSPAGSSLKIKYDELCNNSNPLPNTNESLAIREQIKDYGYNIWRSERTCLQRKLPAPQHSNCSKPMQDLPQVSIIMSYHQIDVSALLRALHSIKNRTPPKLLKELLLIDDASETPELSSRQLINHIYDQFGGVVRVIRLDKQLGSWGARHFGARQALGEVLVFVDPYVEVNEEWLPPLLEPIKRNSRVSTEPVLDTISHDTLRYKYEQPGRLGFDWKLHRVDLEMRPEEFMSYPAPLSTPILNGVVLAIAREWFWHIDAYQTEFYNPWAVQLELSFKLWLCGGQVLQIPCSRVGYLNRHSSGLREEIMELDSQMDKYISFKNLVELWFDEYKFVVYEHKDNLRHLRPDNLQMQQALQRRLNCRAGGYFFKYVAPEIPQRFPYELPEDYAKGEISLVHEPRWCLSTAPANTTVNALSLRPCRLANGGRIAAAQYWTLGQHRQLNQGHRCLEVPPSEVQAKVLFRPCNFANGYSYWFYNYANFWLQHGHRGKPRLCLEALLEERRVIMNKCVANHPHQQWTLTSINMDALDQYLDELDDEEDQENQHRQNELHRLHFNIQV